MRTISSILIFLVLGMTAIGQPIERKEADSLLRVLSNTKPDAERINILIELAQFHIFKPGEKQIDFDSAVTYLSEARRLNESVKSPSLAGQLLLTESFMLREKGQRNPAISKVEEAIKVLQSSGDKYYLGKAYAELSGYYDYSDSKQLAERIRLMELALSCFQQVGDAERIGASYHMLGDLYQLKDEYSKALKYLGLALEAYKSIHHTAVQGIYALMGAIYTSQGDNKQALKYCLLALKTAEDAGDTSLQLCQISNSIGRTLDDLDERQKATFYFDKALTIAEKYNDLAAIYTVSTNLANSWYALGDAKKALHILKSISAKYKKPDDADIDFDLWRCYIVVYTSLKQYANAQPYCDHLLQEFDNESRGQFARIDALFVAANFFIASGQYDLAVNYLNKHRALSQKSTDVYNIANNERLWFMLDTSRHNYNAAVKHLINYNRLNDSLFNETKSKQIAELQVQFETERKEKDILIKDQQIGMLTKEQLLKDMNLKRVKFIKNISLYGSIILLVTGVLFYRQYRRKKRDSDTIAMINQQLKDMLAEKEWWLKEVHHRVKNNLHTIICLLESQAMYLEKDALQAIEKSQHRIYAMSLIHQKLYQNEELRVIDMSIYLEEFIGYLKDSFDTNNIEFILKVDPVQLSLQQAIPVALIINESVTNAIKYAFGNEEGATIQVSMTETDSLVKLTITDNGKGFELSEENERKSLGIQLIRGLSKELKGTVLIESKYGTTLSIVFKQGPLADKIPLLKEEITG